MFFPVKLFWSAAVEQTSPTGSVSPMSVQPPFPSGVTWLVDMVAGSLLVKAKPLVWPEIKLMAPGVDGPNVVVHELSLRA